MIYIYDKANVSKSKVSQSASRYHRGAVDSVTMSRAVDRRTSTHRMYYGVRDKSTVRRRRAAETLWSYTSTDATTTSAVFNSITTTAAISSAAVWFYNNSAWGRMTR